MKIYAIIVIYNGMRNNWIQKCFDSIINSTISCNIIAIDNNSSDNSVNYIQVNYPNVHLIVNKENKGFGGANNQGLKYALDNKGEYFFLLNQDAWVDSDTIEELIKISNYHSNYGIISPIHLNGKGNALDYNFSNYIVPHLCEKLYSDFVLNKIENKIYESDFICAAAWLITRKALEKVGGFSPTFFHYAEDDNYIHRLKYKGLKIGVYPKVFIYHDRENRDNSTFFNKDENYKRGLLLKYSNPNISIDHINNLKRNKSLFLKSIIKFDFKEMRRLNNEKRILDYTYLQTKDNLIKSKENKNYIFL